MIYNKTLERHIGRSLQYKLKTLLFYFKAVSFDFTNCAFLLLSQVYVPDFSYSQNF